jgi:hypothetical protein
MNKGRQKCPCKSRPTSPLTLALTPNRHEMESPRLRLLEMLRFPGVSRETSAVLTTLLHRCASGHHLSQYVLESVDESLQHQEFSMKSVDVLLDGSACSRPLAGVLLRMQLVGLVADALNNEASRWMSDFLLIGTDLQRERGDIADLALPVYSNSHWKTQTSAWNEPLTSTRAHRTPREAASSETRPRRNPRLGAFVVQTSGGRVLNPGILATIYCSAPPSVCSPSRWPSLLCFWVDPQCRMLASNSNERRYR